MLLCLTGTLTESPRINTAGRSIKSDPEPKYIMSFRLFGRVLTFHYLGLEDNLLMTLVSYELFELTTRLAKLTDL